MIYCINRKSIKENTAFTKAPKDILDIAKSVGAEELTFEYRLDPDGLSKWEFLFQGIRNWLKALRKAQGGDYIIIQHPYISVRLSDYFIPLCKKKGIKFIGLIHDLESLRKILGSDSLPNERRIQYLDQVLLYRYDYIICHNDVMKRYLISLGIDDNRMVSLGMFDYLHSCVLPERQKTSSLVIAGNLNRNKSTYVYKWADQAGEAAGYKINLFGPNIGKELLNHEMFEYYGNFEAEELPGKLVGSFGLVWDGDSIETCSGNTGEYLRYNNPHKCSLYIAAGIPVIIWKEAALADYIKRNNLGLLIGSLTEIPNLIQRVSDEEYAGMVRSINAERQKICSGYYFKTALSKII